MNGMPARALTLKGLLVIIGALSCFAPAYGVEPGSRGSEPPAADEGLASDAESSSEADSKLRFDLSRLEEQGLRGPPNGLRALDYEYCIPNRPQAIAAVRAIDPSLRIQAGSPGRIGCGRDQLLCLGNTHQQGFAVVLERLSGLEFVTEIREAFFE